MTTRLLTRANVAAMTGVSQNAVAAAARDGRLAHVQIGNRYWFREADVDAWIDSMRVPARPARQVTARPTPLAAVRAARAAR